MKSKVINIISWIIILIILFLAFSFYKSNNFNEFVRSEMNLHISEFKRDNKVKYNKTASYKIISEQANDATFYKKVKVKKNIPYKVTAMVKTENIIAEDEISGVGAQISIIGSTEKSIAITGTQDWQKLEMIFNSKDREEIDIGFRLGGYLGKCTGTAWFSEFTLEEGTLNENKNWNFACFIFSNTDVIIDGKEIKISVTDKDISDIKNTIKRFGETVNILSEDKMIASCDVYKIDEPINKLTYDKEFGYFVAAEDIENSNKYIIQNNDYDKIIANSSRSYIYRYDTRINTFPEEVFLHEFLHSLERTSEEYGYKIPALHDYEKYGYKSQSLTGLKNWYQDYMNSNVRSSSGYIGLPKEVYTLKPAKNSDFKYSYEIDEFHEPQNIIEDVKQLFKNIINKR